MISRFKKTVMGLINWYHLLALALFFIVIFLMVDVVVLLDRGLQIDKLQEIVVYAIVFSLLLVVFKRIKPVPIVISSILLGIMSSFWMVGDLAVPVFEMLRLGADYVQSTWLYFFNRIDVLPDISSWQVLWTNFSQTVAVLVDRLFVWIKGLPEPAYDPVSINLVWALVVWLVTIWLYWYLVRHKSAFIGAIPVLGIIAGVYQKSDKGLYSLFWVLGFVLLLEILSGQSKMEDDWRENRLSFSVLIRKQTVQKAVGLSLALVFFAGMISSPRLEEFIDDLKQPSDSAGHSSSGERSDSTTAEIISGQDPSEVLADVSFGRFPNTHLLGSGPELAQTRIMYVKIEDQDEKSNDRHYLRSRTYATYTLHGWLTADKGFVLNQPWDVSEIQFNANEKLIYQEVILLDDDEKGNIIYTVGELAAADVPYFTSYHTKFVDDTYLDIFAAVTHESNYAAYSVVPSFGVAELRNSQQDYPAWITSKYLQIPDDVPDRVYELALSLTATEPTAYDRALAIERYLRQFEYTLDLDDPPRYHDVVDYFLFDLQKGFCDYFATSMVVLARAAGLPARFAAGYVAETYNEASDRYIVTADQAHSWVEVYFNGYGWVTFEPTPGLPEPERLEKRENIFEENAIELDFNQPQNVYIQRLSKLMPDNIFLFTLQVILVLIIMVSVIHWGDLLVLRLLDPRKMYAHLYRRLRKQAEGLGVKTKLADTPLEFAALNENFLEKAEPGKPFMSVFQSVVDQANFIITACNRAAYADEPLLKENIVLVISTWGRLRWQYLVVRAYLGLYPIGYSLRRLWKRLWQETTSIPGNSP